MNLKCSQVRFQPGFGARELGRSMTKVTCWTMPPVM